jgi:DNA-directed RNA polymerase subunit beta'
VKHPITGELIVDVNQEITDEISQAIEDAGIEGVRIRSVLTCDSKYGVCGFCYGRNLATYKSIEIGEAVGIIAAQSIGQPGTQLTMRTFHIGGAATKISEENPNLPSSTPCIDTIQGSMVKIDNGNMLFTRKGTSPCTASSEPRAAEGDKVLVKDRPAPPEARRPSHPEEGRDDLHSTRSLREGSPAAPYHQQPQHIEIRNGAEVSGRDAVVPAEETIAFFDPFSEPIIAEATGTLVFHDIVLGTTLKEEVNEDTGKIEKKITEYTLETLQPRITIDDDKGNELAAYFLPGNAYLNVDEGRSRRGASS